MQGTAMQIFAGLGFHSSTLTFKNSEVSEKQSVRFQGKDELAQVYNHDRSQETRNIFWVRDVKPGLTHKKDNREAGRP